MFIRIAVIEPANVAETYIVASTVIACTGSNVNVKGNSKAAPVVAPRPGNTPRITPNTVVIKIKNIRFRHWRRSTRDFAFYSWVSESSYGGLCKKKD